MFSENKILVLITAQIILCSLFAFGQLQTGLSFGYNFNVAKTIPSQYLLNKGLELSFRYKNKSPFIPFFSFTNTKAPLNFAASLIDQEKNTILIINDELSAKLMLGVYLKRDKKLNCFANLGFGASRFFEPRLFAVTYNVFFFQSGNITTNYSPTRKYILNSFIDASLIAEKSLSEKWNICIEIGSKYYPRNTDVSISTTLNKKEVIIDSAFLIFRPYAKIGCAFNFKKSN